MLFDSKKLCTIKNISQNRLSLHNINIRVRKLHNSSKEDSFDNKKNFFQEEKEKNKVHHEIINPENIYDLITKFRTKDIITTLLSKNVSFSGDINHKFIIKDIGSVKKLDFFFASVGIEWMKTFNEQIISLKDINLTVPKSILNDHNHFKEFIKLHQELFTETKNSFTQSSLSDLFQKLENKIIENSNNNENTLSENLKSDVASFALLYHYQKKILPEEFGLFLNFVSSIMQNWSKQDISRFLTYVLHTFFVKKDHLYSEFGPFFITFLKTLEKNGLLSIYDQFSCFHLDKLACLFSINGNLNHANSILKKMVLNLHYSPSDTTLDCFLSSYDSSTDKENFDFLGDLVYLKSVFFHKNLSNIALNFILNFTVFSLSDFSQLLHLIDLKPNKNKIWSIHHELLIKKFLTIQSNYSSSNEEKLMHLNSLLKIIFIDNKVNLSIDSINTIKDFLMNMGLINNYNYFVNTFTNN